MLRMGPTVSVGAGTLAMVGRPRRWAEGVGSPDMPPADFTQLATMSASVCRAVLEAEKKVGKVAPGTVPFVVLVYSLAVRNAACNWAASPEPEPTLAYPFMKLESAAAAPTVVSSLTAM